jgi:hypothetical protein
MVTQDAWKVLIGKYLLVKFWLGVFGNNVSNIGYFVYELCIFIGFLPVQALIKEL